jgi:hypothetical protein
MKRKPNPYLIASLLLAVFIILNPPIIRSSTVFDSIVFYASIIATVTAFLIIIIQLISIQHEKKIFRFTRSETTFLLSLIFASSILFLIIPVDYSYQNDVPYYEFVAQSVFMSGSNIDSSFLVYGPHAVIFGTAIDIINTFTHDIFLAGKLTAILFFSISLALLYSLLRLLTNRRIAMIGTILPLGAFEFFRSGFLASQEIIGVAITLIFLMAFFLTIKGSKSAFTLLILIIPLLIQARSSNALLLIPAAIIVIWKKGLILSIKDNWKAGAIAALLILPFATFLLFSDHSLLHAMDSYNNGFAEQIGWSWWDGVFSFSYFTTIFPSTLETIFFPSLMIGAVSFIALPLILVLPYSRWKGWTLASMLFVQSVVLSSHFMSMNSSALDPRYVPHVIILAVILSSYLLFTLTDTFKPTKKVLLPLLIIVIALTLFQLPTFYQKTIAQGTDPEWRLMENIKPIVPEGCDIAAAPRFARNYLFYLNGYTLTHPNLVTPDHCTYHLCYDKGKYGIEQTQCDQYQGSGPW